MKKQKSGDHLITPMAVRLSAIDNLEAIIGSLSKPSGFAKLAAEKRKFLLGVILAAVIPADLKIRQSEVVHLQKIMTERLNCPVTISEDILSLACSKPQPPHITEILARALPELLGSEDLINLIGQLWELAIVDQELHEEEERLIYRVADIAGVPRKRVADQLARAATRI